MSNQYSFMQNLARKLLFNKLKALTGINLIINEQQQCHKFISDTEQTAIEITIHNGDFYSELLLNGSLGVGTSYIHGDWDCNNLKELFKLYIKHQSTLQKLDNLLTMLIGVVHKPLYFLQKHDRQSSKQYIAQHYDLGNEFFQLFLDETMMYSSAIFREPSQSLHQASITKLARICDKLQLQPGEKVIEIGSGWGGFAMYAAQHYGVEVTTTTISEQQYAYTKAKVDQYNLGHLVTVIKQDYRDLQGQYDKLVSIEMIEAIGYHNFASYFAKVSQLLKPTGAALIQAIAINDQHYSSACRHIDFIKHYIFPGGCLPAISVMMNHVRKKTDLQLFHLESIGDDYVKTLQCWREAFINNQQKITEEFDQVFYRKWIYYFNYCEAGFASRYINDHQLLFIKPQSSLQRVLGDLA